MLDGLSHSTDRGAIVQAVLEGVAFAIADCRDALAETGSGWPAHRFSASMARSSGISKLKVSSDGGRGRTLSEASAISPRVPREPASSLDTS